MAASTFRLRLLEDSKLQESLTMRHPKDMRQLMRRIEKYKRLEDDQQQSKCKAPISSQPRQGGFHSRPWRDLRIQEPSSQAREVNVVFKELVHRIMDRVKNKPYFQWPNKMRATPREEIGIYTAISKGGAFKGICCGAKKSKGWTRCPTQG